MKYDTTLLNKMNISVVIVVRQTFHLNFYSMITENKYYAIEVSSYFQCLIFKFEIKCLFKVETN
jgi:hypothetical protein